MDAELALCHALVSLALFSCSLEVKESSVRRTALLTYITGLQHEPTQFSCKCLRITQVTQQFSTEPQMWA